MDRETRIVEVYDICECGRRLDSLREAERGQCSCCWMKSLPKDVSDSLLNVIKATFTRPDNTDEIIQTAMDKLRTCKNVKIH